MAARDRSQVNTLKVNDENLESKGKYQSQKGFWTMQADAIERDTQGYIP